MPCPPVAVPRAIAPLSTSRVTSRRPTLHWVLAGGDDGARVEICRDRACTATETVFDVEGTSGAPPRRLAPGLYYWRLRGIAGGTVGHDVSPSWQFAVGERGAPVDTSWGSTVDVNGDGFSDVVAGTPNANNLEGAVHIYLGGTNGVAATPITVPAPEDNGPFSEFGASVTSAGDVNGDGYADLVVGASGGGASTGAAYVLLGGPHGLSQPTALPGPTKQVDFGWMVASAGDVNGDGYADIAVIEEGSPQPFAVYLGSAGGITTTPIWIDPPSAVASLAGAGDVNGDGFGDVVVGSFYANHAAGAAYLYLGSASGLSAVPITIDSPTGSYGFFAQSLAGGADVNGDGYADIVVGAPGETPAAYVYLGDEAGVATTPIALPAPAGPYDYLVSPYAIEFGATVASAGDVNGDGFDEVIVGDPGFVSYLGAVYLYTGSAAGLSPTPQTLGLAGATGTRFGGCIAGGGDVDRDGFADIVVGVFDVGYTRDPGLLTVFRGTAAGASPTPTDLTCPNEVMAVAE